MGLRTTKAQIDKGRHDLRDRSKALWDNTVASTRIKLFLRHIEVSDTVALLEFQCEIIFLIRDLNIGNS